jgi:hypothetical protein
MVRIWWVTSGLTTPRDYWWSLMIKSDCQLRFKKEEKLIILNTYAFTIHQVPHVFGEHYFAGHKHKYMEKFIERRFLTLICAKE